MTSEVFSRLQSVNGAAIGALGGTTVAHIQINLGMGILGLHMGQRARAKHAALVIQVFGKQFNRGGLGFGHGGFLMGAKIQRRVDARLRPCSANGRIWGCDR